MNPSSDTPASTTLSSPVQYGASWKRWAKGILTYDGQHIYLIGEDGNPVFKLTLGEITSASRSQTALFIKTRGQRYNLMFGSIAAFGSGVGLAGLGGIAGIGGASLLARQDKTSGIEDWVSFFEQHQLLRRNLSTMRLIKWGLWGTLLVIVITLVIVFALET